MSKQNKQHNPWGGRWTEKKLETFASYVRAYLVIMNRYRDKFRWKILYFDGFAGTGSRSAIEQEKEKEAFINMLGNEQLYTEDLFVYQGAAERVVKLEEEMRGFDFYYFIDCYKENCQKLENKLSGYNTKGRKVFRIGDANDIIKMLVAAMKKDKKLKSLVFLDPFGMQINWNSIKSLAIDGVDLWVLLPTGVIVNRLLKCDGSLLCPEKLESFFGMKKDDIQKHFYKKEVDINLFGDKEEKYIKTNNSITQIANLYCRRMGEIFKYVTSEPLVLKNENNVPIYHFVCASNNQKAVKIAQNIINKRQ